MLHSAVITCPWCWERNHLSVDCSAGDAEIVEDCTVCCRPMVVRIHLDASGDLAGVEVSREND